MLFNLLETNSRMSVFRRLKLIGYLTSYTDAGRYYTLQNIPKFDSWGLWIYKGIGFSQSGSLKETVIRIVKSSSGGMAPKELMHLLKIRVPNTLHNALHGLIKSNSLSKHRLEGLSIYADADPDLAQKQVNARRQEIQKDANLVEPLSSETTIAVLVEALKVEKVIASPTTIVKRLAIRGLSVTVEQVNRILSMYEIQAEKKTIRRQ